MPRETMFCSTIIPTINRRTLTRAIHSVLDQDFNASEHEIIVVNDSGQSLPHMEWQASERVRVIDTNRRERSVARNTGAAIAKGEYLHFLDDDDILLPGALNAFWELAQKAQNAAWLYGSYQTVDNDWKVVEEFHPGLKGNIFAPLVSGESIPIQVSLLGAKQFHAVGGFDSIPLFTGVEDRDLGRRLALIGSVAWTPTLVGQIRIGEQGSTTNWSKLADGDRLGREKALGTRNAFPRLCAGISSDYWRGRVSRAFFGSVLMNVRQRDLFVAMSRFASCLAIANWHVLVPDFWTGLRTKNP